MVFPIPPQTLLLTTGRSGIGRGRERRAALPTNNQGGEGERGMFFCSFEKTVDFELWEGGLKKNLSHLCNKWFKNSS